MNQWGFGVMDSTGPVMHDGKLACFVLFVLCVVLFCFETRPHCVAIQAGLKLPDTLLLQPPTCCTFRCESPWRTVLFCLFVEYWELNSRAL